MTETPETHKEIVEIKKEVREIRLTQDAEIFHNRSKWEDLLWTTLDNNVGLMRLLIAIDGVKSRTEIEKQTKLSHATCWAYADKLERTGIITKAENTKGGSPVFVKLRWYNILRLDEEVAKRIPSDQGPASPPGQETLQQGSGSNEEQPQNPAA